MSLANYGDLQDATADWLFRKGDADLAARAPEFISLFENEFVLDPEMRTLEMEEIDQAPIASAYVALPDGFLEMIYLKTATQVFTYVSPDRAAVLDTSNGQQSCGQCKNYTVLAGQIVFTPQQWAPTGQTLEMAYYAFQPLASSQNGTNWLMSKYPNIYLYGSLMQTAAFVDDKDTVNFWSTALTLATTKLAKSDKKRKVGAAPLRVTPSVGFRT